MAVNFSSAGCKVAWAVEATAGTKPSAFAPIPGAKSIPPYTTEPETIQTTSLDETTYHTYVAALVSAAGSIGITFNESDALHTAWDSIKSAYDTAKASGKAVWFEYYVPNLTKAFYMTVDVMELGFGGAEVGSVMENTGYIVPTGNIGWDTKIVPTT